MQKILFLIVPLLLLVSCGDQSTISFDKEEFDRQRALWEAQGLEDYSVIQEIFSPAGPSDARVFVGDTAIYQIENLTQYENYNPDNFYPFMTVSYLYTWIANGYTDSVNRITRGEKADLTIRIRYNDTWHYPEDVYFNYMPQYMWGMDGYGPTTYKLSDFIPGKGEIPETITNSAGW